MKRRHVLVSTGAIVSTPLGGCLDSGIEGANDGGNGSRTTHIVDVTPDAPSDLSVTPEVSVVVEAATVETPASIAVGWENEGPDAVRLGEKRSITFHAVPSDDENCHLLNDGWGDWDETVSFDHCWYVSETISGGGAFRVVELAPGETYEGDARLYADSDRCLSSGAYRFQTAITAWNPEESEGDGETVEWGFVLDVETEG